MVFYDDAVFASFATHATAVLLKMMLMGPITGFYRFTRKAFSNPEDCMGNKEEAKKSLRTDPSVERVRRCHQNDIENILPFLGVGLLYALSGPDPWIALLHFRVFLASRIVHTIAYLAPLPQPTRAIAYLLGVVSTFSMAVAVMRLRVYV
ncbi:microsomal glutathione S-transferase 1 [Lampetra fluviatilis]